jgi:hypothetical protein
MYDFVTGLLAGLRRIDYRQWQEMILFRTGSILTPESIEPPMQCVAGTFPGSESEQLLDLNLVQLSSQVQLPLPSPPSIFVTWCLIKYTNFAFHCTKHVKPLPILHHAVKIHSSFSSWRLSQT